ncbi:TPA_asm: hypothetical protein G1Q02_17450 [Salmonella enterica subsp. enterica serovar Typhimurium]|nr:hypothetical protein [Salmonella enterica subsp. enterica serovar Typhimurium]
MSIRRGWAYSGGGIKPCSEAGVIALGHGEVFSVPASLRQKLLPQNNIGLGSVSSLGNVLNTRDAPMPLLDVINNWLTNKLTADELALITRNRDRFTFAIGVGDRREAFKSRIVEADNWHGEDANNLKLTPNPPGAPAYNFTLSFTAANAMTSLTDSHAGQPNTYGALRYLTVRVR